MMSVMTSGCSTSTRRDRCFCTLTSAASDTMLLRRVLGFGFQMALFIHHSCVCELAAA